MMFDSDYKLSHIFHRDEVSTLFSSSHQQETFDVIFVTTANSSRQPLGLN